MCENTKRNVNLWIYNCSDKITMSYLVLVTFINVKLMAIINILKTNSLILWILSSLFSWQISDYDWWYN